MYYDFLTLSYNVDIVLLILTQALHLSKKNTKIDSYL